MKCLLIFLAALTSLAMAADRPNFVIVVSDDLGYGDLACYGSKDTKTPNLDKFATEGLRFTSCYAGHGNCSPSRTALLTGRTPTRVGVRDWIPEESPVHVRASEITVAKLLQQAGYATCQSGKWHLNGEFNKPTQPQPNDHGFDHWFATQNNAYPNHHNPDNFVRNGKELGRLEGYAADLVADEAQRWLGARDKTRPFFLYVGFHEPHEPIAAAAKYTALYPSEDPSYSAHHGNISQMDAAFGRLMQTLDEQGLRENTLVLFTSDNGPAITPQHPHGSSGPLRDKKGSLYEGGIRIPGILRWPSHTKPGSISDEPICGVDLLPTLCEIASIPAPTDRVLDGASFLPVLKGEPVVRKTPLYWHFNRASGGMQVAMRVGDWKILAKLDHPQAPRGNGMSAEIQQEFKTAMPIGYELYNLREDLAESKDLATAEPERLKDLSAQLLKKYLEVRAESPIWPNWKSTGVEGKHIQWPDYVTKKKKKAK